MSRYLRQVILDEIGEAGQKALGETRVLCVGAGGLGSPAALYLVAAGIGKLGLIDFDTVDESNLQRQILFSTQDQGRKKTEAARERLNALNPQVALETFSEALTANNALQILGGYDIVIDGTDRFSAKFLINDAAAKLGMPLIYGSISQWQGEASVFWAKHGPCYRCLHPKPPETKILSCAESGIIGAVAGMIGSTQALQTVQIALMQKGVLASSMEPLIGRLFVLDSTNMDSRTFIIPKRRDCPTCSKASHEITLSDETAGTCTLANDDVTTIPENCLVVDVREAHEWRENPFPGSINIPLSIIEAGDEPEQPESDKMIVLVCRVGTRSRRALSLLSNRGWTNLRNLVGGIVSWKGPLSGGRR